MNAQVLVDPTVCSRLCMTLLHSFWQVTLFAAVAWALDRLWRRLPVERSYAVHVAALVAGLVIMPITYSLVETARPVSVARAENVVESVGSTLPPVATSFSANPPEAVELASHNIDIPPAPANTPLPASSEISAKEYSISWPDVAPSIATLYAIGVLVMLVRVVVSIWRAQRLGAAAQPIGDRALIDRLNLLARNWSIRVVPVLARAEQVVVPKLVGLLRPTILLPSAAITGLSADEMEMILAHKLAHLRRHDMWVNLLQRLAEALLFFNPALWYLSRRISTLREYCCDEMTCRAMSNTDAEPRTRYASALLRVVELGASSGSELGSTPVPASADLAALAASGRSPSELRRRMARLFGEPIREPLRISRSGLITLAIAAALLLTGPAVWHSAADSAPAETADSVADDSADDHSDPSTASDQGKKDTAAAEDEEYTVPITVFGKATDGYGHPIVGATIYMAALRPGDRRLAETKTNEDGFYRFENILLPISRADTNAGRDSGIFELFDFADGYALAWRPKRSFYPNRANVLDTRPSMPEDERRTGYGTEDPIELDLKFGSPTSIRGRITNDRGEPIPETELAIRSCDTYWDLMNGDRILRTGSLDSLNTSAIVPSRIKTQITATDGRFEFTGLPSNYRWRIDVRPPKHPPRTIWAVTNEGDHADGEGSRVYRGDFEVVFAAPRAVKLRVVYDDTGEPAAKVGVGGRVTKAGFWETTDDDGYVETRLPDGRYKLGLLPRYGTPYLKTNAEIAVSADSANELATLRLRAAAVVNITVVDADSNEPLSDVDVWIDKTPAGADKRHRPVYGYRSWEAATRISRYERPRADKNGKMRVLFEPGKHRIGVGLLAFPKGYAPVDTNGKEIECRASEPMSVEFRMRQVMDSQGDPNRNLGAVLESEDQRSVAIRHKTIRSKREALRREQARIVTEFFQSFVNGNSV